MIRVGRDEYPSTNETEQQQSEGDAIVRMPGREITRCLGASRQPDHNHGPSSTLIAIYADSTTDMDLRKSFLKPFKKLKDKLPGDRHKRDGRSGGGNDRKGGEADIEGSGSRSGLYLHSELGFESAVESEPGQGGSNVDGAEAALVNDPATSTRLISWIRKPDSM